MGIYDIEVKAQDGSTVSMGDYKGKVLLIVNTATQCGFTPSYPVLQQLYAKYRDQGFELLDFPCNQFGMQAPGSDAEIHEFCVTNFGTEFPQFSKVDVNGADAAPLFVYLKQQKGFEGFGDGPQSGMFADFVSQNDPNYASSPDIKWNFTKFLVDRDGNVVARFEPIADFAEIDKAIASLI